MRLFGSFRRVVIFSAVISVASALCGLVIALFAETPPGPTIVAVNAAVFAVFCVLGRLLRRRLN